MYIIVQQLTDMIDDIFFCSHVIYVVGRSIKSNVPMQASSFMCSELVDFVKKKTIIRTS